MVSGLYEKTPEYFMKKAQLMNPVKAQKFNKFIIDDHLNDNEVYDDLDLKKDL